MIASLAILSGCGHNGGTGHNHDHETHEVHEHSHDHDGHGHEGHDHDVHGKEAHNHGKDIIEFSQARAEAAGLKTETVKPGKFNAAIRTSGEILPAQGTERTIVATTSGVISLGGKPAAFSLESKSAKEHPWQKFLRAKWLKVTRL